MDELHQPPGSLPPPVAPGKQPDVNIIPEPEDPDQPATSDNKSPLWREILSTFGILITALIVAVLMIGFVFRSYQVDGQSMQNTLMNADKLIIWKVPRTWARITGHPYIPHRGDIIVFTESGLAQFGQADTKQLIKRVIGLPGDTIEVHDGNIIVINKAHPNGYDPDNVGGYKIVQPTTGDRPPVTLGPDQLFVCGDNRPDSLDSRSFGPINANQVIGKLALRLFPINQARVF